MSKKNKIYFTSDFHLGAPNHTESIKREKKICLWLDNIKNDAKEIYLVGDIFDFWFEYKTAIPKGFERLKGKLCELTDSGVTIHFFPGNHDLWTFGYLEKELGLIIHKKPLTTEIYGKTFYIAHGDGLGRGDFTYTIIKNIFNNNICQYLFSTIHPNIGIWLAKVWSKKSRNKGGFNKANIVRNQLINYSKEILKNQNINYFIFGHIHEPIEIELNQFCKYINIGDCISHFSFLELDESNLLIKYF